jgi:Ser/Thr protein kinase RdoA (MazF antagonist)
MTQSQLPFYLLDPDAILNAVASAGLCPDGRLLALNSYENRVYQVGIEDSMPVVVKFYRPQRWSDAEIHEEHAFVRELADAEIPVVAPLAFAGQTLLHHQHEDSDFRFAIFPKQGGRAPELDRAGNLEWMGRFIGRIHAIGALKPFELRPSLDIESFGLEPRDYLLAHDFIPQDLREVYAGVAAQALDGVMRCYERAGRVSVIRLHGDCHMGNVLWTDDGPHFVDFDDSRNGPAIQDIWMLLSGERSEMTGQLNDFLAGYEDFKEFDTRELYLVEALRTLRLIHYAAWLARRWDDPAFPAAFPWFNTQRYWQDRILELREQIALMDEPPLIFGNGNNWG